MILPPSIQAMELAISAYLTEANKENWSLEKLQLAQNFLENTKYLDEDNIKNQQDIFIAMIEAWKIEKESYLKIKEMVKETIPDLEPEIELDLLERTELATALLLWRDYFGCPSDAEKDFAVISLMFKMAQFCGIQKILEERMKTFKKVDVR